MVIIVQGIIQDVDQDDVLFVDLLDSMLLSAHNQSSPQPRMQSMTRTQIGRQKQNGMNQHGRMKSMKLLRVRKAKARDLSRREV